MLGLVVMTLAIYAQVIGHQFITLDVDVIRESRIASSFPTMAFGTRSHIRGSSWLDQAKCDVLNGHPRSDESRPFAGVFNTRSPAPPNLLGLHHVTVRAIEGVVLRALHSDVIFWRRQASREQRIAWTD